MSNVLKRRLAKIEQAAQPVKQLKITLLAQPAGDASSDAWDKHHAALAEIEGSGGMAIVLVGVCPTHGSPPDSHTVRHVKRKTEAQVLALSLQPSERGNKDRLADVLGSLKGNVLGVVPDPVDCEDEA